MKYMKISCLAAVLSALTACVYTSTTTETTKAQDAEAATQVQMIEPYQHDVIALENLYTRVIAYCYNSYEYTAEECADFLEKDGFVRVSELPRITAEHDFLTTGTYPTRRWRNDDFVPRW